MYPWSDSGSTMNAWTVFPSLCDPFDNEVDPHRRARF
jgi:hypothetical protein